jgi:hypothetical protein
MPRMQLSRNKLPIKHTFSCSCLRSLADVGVTNVGLSIGMREVTHVNILPSSEGLVLEMGPNEGACRLC